MSRLDGWHHRIAVLLGRGRYQRDIDAEVRLHLELDAIHVRSALTARDAAMEAARHFGNVTYVREEVRRMTGYTLLDDLTQDVRFALRGLKRSRGFALAVIAALALGIGANTAIFSFLNDVVLQPLPYAAPSRLMLLSTQLIGTHEGASLPDYLDWRDRTRSFSTVSAYLPSADNFATPGQEPERLRSARVSSNFFALLGVAPSLGRNFTAADQVFGSHFVVIISDALWHRQFNADRGVIGKTIILNTLTYTIVGVAPPSLQLPARAELWLPLAFDPSRPPLGRRNDFLGVIGRLKPGVTPATAQAEMSTIAGQLAKEYPASNASVGVLLQPLQEVIVGKSRSALILFAVAVGLVLLIACANVANLLLARAATRGRELAVRVALGAGRGRILRQLLTESVLLAMLGGVGGILVAVMGVRGLKALVPVNFPRLDTVHVDGTALVFSAVLSILTGVLFGIAPALRGSRDALGGSLTEGGRGNTGTRAERLRGALVIAQTALALLLLSGAGLMVRSLLRLEQVQLGFDPHGTVAAFVVLPQAKYADSLKQAAFFSALRDRVRTIPGVQGVGLTTDVPLGGGYNYLSVTIAGRAAPGPGEAGPDAIPTVADSDYFGVMRMSLREGRLFGAADRLGAPKVVVVNDEMVRRHFGGKSPLGVRITLDDPTDSSTWATIVGVVGSTRLDGVGQASYPQVFAPAAQQPSRAMYIIMRTAGNPLAMVPALRREVAALDPVQPITDIKSMDDRVADSLGGARLNSVLLAVFSSLALLLASLGIYAVVAYSVAQRTREIGIRMALGASADGVLRLMLRQAMRPVLIGTVAGLVGSFALAQLVRGLVFEVPATDPVSLIGATALLAAVAAIACAIPASRAARILPTEALRGD